jgi:hypothetical protein
MRCIRISRPDLNEVPADAAHCASLPESDDLHDMHYQNHTVDIDGCCDEPVNQCVLPLVGELGRISSTPTPP